MRPGEHFHYNNMLYEVLGLLAWTLDGRELPEVLRERILRPLGMSQSEPVITLDVREKTVKNYASVSRTTARIRAMAACPKRLP